MFPLNWNIPFIKKNGVRSTLGKELSASTYTLPTASAAVKGGVKIGSGLTMTGEVLSVSGGVYTHYVRIKSNTEVGCVIILVRNNATPVTLTEIHNMIYNEGTPKTLYCLNTYATPTITNVIISVSATETGFTFNQMGGSSSKTLTQCSVEDTVLS